MRNGFWGDHLELLQAPQLIRGVVTLTPHNTPADESKMRYA